jgi:peptide/nickel transport system permease protein
VTRHIIPNLGAILVLNLTLGVVSTVLSETALSFLGFGIKAPDVSLGSLLSDGTSTITTAPWILGFPSLVLVLLTVSLTLVGDGLRDAVDPSSRTGSMR